jgi:membrane-bound ClpP family serine protease
VRPASQRLLGSRIGPLAAIDPAWRPLRPDREAKPPGRAPSVTGAVAGLLVLGSVLLAARLLHGRSAAMAWAGTGAMIAGVVLAAHRAGPAGLVLALVVPVLMASIAIAIVLTRMTVVAARGRSRCGAEGLVGRLGVVRRPLAPVGQVRVAGEIWRARRSWPEDGEPPREGEAVVVDRVDHLTLCVRRAESWEVEW